MFKHRGMIMNWLKSGLLLALVFVASCAAPQPAPPTPALVATAVSMPTAAPAAIETAAPTVAPTPEPAPNTLLVNPTTSLGPISPYVYGTNYGPWVSLRMETLPLAYDAGLTVVRWPGGEWGDANDIQPYQIDGFVDLARKMGAEPYIHVRFVGSTPEKAAEIVRYTNKEKGYNIKFWSIGNEPSLYEQGQGERTQWDAARFSQEWRQFADAMKTVDPTILLLGPETHQFTGNPAWDPKDSQGRDWMREFLKINGDKVDIVSFHRYPFPNTPDRSSAKIPDLRNDAPTWSGIVQNLRQTIAEETGRDLPVAVTEFNSHWSRSISGEATPDSHYNAIWLADVLGRLITEKVDVATQFLLVSGSEQSGFGLLERYNPRPSYFTYQLYKRFGQELVASSSTVAGVSVYAARRDDGALTIMAINLNDDEVAAPLLVTDLAPNAVAEVWRLDADHQAERIDDQALAPGAKVTLAPQSVTLLIVPE